MLTELAGPHVAAVAGDGANGVNVGVAAAPFSTASAAEVEPVTRTNTLPVDRSTAMSGPKDGLATVPGCALTGGGNTPTAAGCEVNGPGAPSMIVMPPGAIS